MRPWIAVAYSAPVAAATAVFIIYPIGQGSFSDGMPLGKNFHFLPHLCIYIQCLLLLLLIHTYPLKISKISKISLISVISKISKIRKGVSVYYAESLEGVEENREHPTPREGRSDTYLNGESPKPIVPLEGTVEEGNPVPNQIQPRLKPGLYMIRCTANDWRYYGESGKVAARISSHKSMLNHDIHPNRLLKADWKKFGEGCFEFVVLYMGPEWQDPAVRRGKEMELIVLDRSRCYNIVESASRPGAKNSFYGRVHTAATKQRIGDAMRGVPNDALGKKVSIQGHVYASIAEASRQTTHSRKLIRDRVNNDQYPDWKIVSDAGEL